MNDSTKPKTPPRRKIDFDRIGSKILVALNQKYLESQSYYVSFKDIAAAIPNEPRNAITDELILLRKQGTIAQRIETRHTNPFAGFTGQAKSETYEAFVDGYTITRDGIAEVNKLTDEAYEVLLTEISIEQPATEHKAAIDSWEPLALDRQSTEFAKAVEATDTALKEIEGSNGYADSNNTERNSVVDTIKTNLSLLRNGLISRGQIIEGLIRPLRFIGAKFADASIGELATRAAKFLWMLIGGN